MAKRKDKLVRSLGFMHTFFIGLGAIIGGSIVVLIGPTIALSGTLGALFTLIFSSLVATLTALVYTEITSAIPEVGGGYIWAKLTMPRPFPFFAGWINWLAHTMAGTFYALSFAVMFTQLFQGLGFHLGSHLYLVNRMIALALIFVFAYLNYSGTAKVGWFSVLIGVFFVSIILLYGVYGTFLGINTGKLSSALFDSVQFTNLPSIFVSMITVVIAFEGYEILAQTAEEAKSPLKSLPKAILLTLASATFLYLIVTISTMGILGDRAYEFSAFFGDRTVMEAASFLFNYGGPIIALSGLATILSSINSTMFSSSRVLLAMARAGEFPKFFSEIHEKHKTPSKSILFTAAIMAVMSFFMDLLLSAFVVGTLFNLLFIVVNYSGIKLRLLYEKKLNYGFKTPLFPIIPLSGLVVKIFFFFAALIFSPIATLITLGLVALGGVLYKGFFFKYEVEHELPIVTAYGSLIRKDFRVMVLYPSSKKMGIVQVAAHIAKQKDGEVNIAHIIKVPEQTPLSFGSKLMERDAKPLKDITDHLNEIGVPARYIIRVAHSVPDALLASLEQEKIDLLIADLEDEGRLVSRIELARRAFASHPMSGCDLLLVNSFYPYVSYIRAKSIIVLGRENEKSLAQRVEELFPGKEITLRVIESSKREEIMKVIEEIRTSGEEVGIIVFSYSLWSLVRRYKNRIFTPFMVFKRGAFSMEEFKSLFIRWR